MSVAELLGLDGNSELLDRARQLWPEWTANDYRLAVVDQFDDLSGWLPTVCREEADEVLLALAMLAAPDGGDDLAAAAAVAKCLLPGACSLAAWLCSLLPQGAIRDSKPAMQHRGANAARIDELVASQLWIEIRTFPWRRLTKVAANVLMNTKAGVIREAGMTVSRGADKTWHNTTVVGTDTELALLAEPSAPDPDASSPVDELLDVLAWACDNQVISAEDRYLLVCLVEQAHQLAIRNTRRGYGGLLSTELSIRVGPRVGASQATVRRRAARTVRALAAAVATTDRPQPVDRPKGGGGGEADDR